MSLPLAKLSTLGLLRGFVAVGRRMSITLAAEELCLTQSAVSRQVQTLEEALGVQLLQRRYRAIALTPAGERLFRTADGAVQQLQDVMDEIGANAANRARPAVTLSASIGFCGLWLLPRLGDWQQRHPGIDVHIAANNRLVDLTGEGIDIAVRYAAPSPATKNALRLFDETVAPVAHPALCFRTLASAKDLADQVLLEFDDPRHPFLQWRGWLKTRQWGAARPRAILRFNQYDQVIHAALAGQGIALGRLALLGPMLKDGRLAQLAPAQPGNRHAYWLMQAAAVPRADVRKLIAWLSAEAQPPAPPKRLKRER